MINVDAKIRAAYEQARERYAALGIDTDAVLQRLAAIPVSMHCWQGDDVIGFEPAAGALTGGIQTSGNYPGRARNIGELRADLEVALKAIPGKKRLNLHAIYLDWPEKVERDKIEPKHFAGWVEWARLHDMGLDFNPTCFSHPLSCDNFTLSHPDEKVRQFWIDHCVASRKVSEYFGRELATPAVMNIWVPDGMKDLPADRFAPRMRLMASLDAIMSATTGLHHKVAVEGKLFGIGAESYTVGSNDFYMAYAATHKTLLTLDAGHFHPTENVADKISTALLFVDELLLHVSRPVRWDSDHVVLFDEATLAIAQEIVRSNALDKVHIGLDYFDASINRIAAWILGMRNMSKALLVALLEPRKQLIDAESAWDYTARLALFEEQKSMPWSAVWEYYCSVHNVAPDMRWLDDVRAYEKQTLQLRR